MSLQKVDDRVRRRRRRSTPRPATRTYSCLGGDCPSFLTVETRSRARATRRSAPPPLAADALARAARPGRARPARTTSTSRGRRHRRHHHQRAALLGGADRRPARAELRPDRRRAEVGPGAVEPGHRAPTPAGRRQQGRRSARPTSTWRSTCSARRTPRQPRPLRPRAHRGAGQRPRVLPSGEMVRNVALRVSPDAPSATRSPATRAPTARCPSTRGAWPRALFGDYMATNLLRARRRVPGRAPAAHRRRASSRPSS